jgi:hypothetical protein
METNLNPDHYIINFNGTTYGLIEKKEIEGITFEAFNYLVVSKHHAEMPKAYNLVIVQDEGSSNMRPLDRESFDEWNVKSDKNPVTNGKIKNIYRFAFELNGVCFEPLNCQDLPKKKTGNGIHEIDVSPGFSPLRIFTKINLNDTEHFNQKSFENLIKINNFFTLAVAQNGFSIDFYCFDAMKLFESKNILVNPITNENIGIIFYYACTLNKQNEMLLELIGHSKEVDKKKELFRECYFKAVRGDIKAQVKLGHYYKQGKGTEVNFEKAFTWFSKAANSDTEANLNKGICLFEGKGVKKDEIKAKDIFEKISTLKIKGELPIRAKFHIGLYFLEKEEYTKSKPIFQEIYNKNKKDSDAQYYLAKSLLHPGSKYIKEGMWHLQQLAGNDHKEALYLFGFLYSIGCVVPQDQANAFHFYKASAKLGHLKAKYQLSLCYLEGIGVEKNVNKAKLIFDSPELKNESEFHNSIGSIYYSGLRIEKDFKSAFKHFNISANLGYEKGIRNIADCYLNGIGVGQDVQKALELYKSLAIKGHTDAEFRLGEILLSGNMVNADIKEGLKWLNSAAEKNHPDAQMTLASYFHAKNNEEGYKRAFSWFTRCAKVENAKQNPAAKYYLAMCYLEGKGAQKNQKQALRWMEEAAKGKDSSAEYLLGSWYGVGFIVKKDYLKAEFFLKSSSEKGNLHAHLALGSIYMRGAPVIKQDLEKAKHYFTLASKLGNQVARFKLALCHAGKNSSNNIGITVDVVHLLQSCNNVKFTRDELLKHYSILRIDENTLPEAFKIAVAAVIKD